MLTLFDLGSTDVYGDATVLRSAIPGLDSNWGSWQIEFSLCSDYAGGCPAGSSAITDAATFACCIAIAGLTRDAAGVCIDATQG